MKVLTTVLTAIALTAGAALADATMPMTTTQQTVTPSTSTTVTTTTATCPVMPATTTMVMPTTTMVMPMTPMAMGTTTTMCPMPGGMATTMTNVQMATCPVGMMMAAPCAAKTSMSINNHPQVLVLGSEESFALTNLGVRRLNWMDTAMNSPSVFSGTNPLTNNMPNASITRHGNPNFPYYAVDRSVRVAGSMEQYTRTMPTSSQDMLNAVKERYRGLTPQQAMAMGYMPMQACVQNVGFVYLNQSIIDNKFDPMMPEAFVFNNDGKLASVQYIVLSDVPFGAFGHPFQASPMVAGALQLPVWLYQDNNAGMFTFANTNFTCNTTMTMPAMNTTTTTMSAPMTPAPRQY